MNGRRAPSNPPKDEGHGGPGAERRRRRYLATRVAAHVGQALRERFEKANALQAHDPADVEAGRRYVQEYVVYIHLVEDVVGLLHGGAHAH